MVDIKYINLDEVSQDKIKVFFKKGFGSLLMRMLIALKECLSNRMSLRFFLKQGWNFDTAKKIYKTGLTKALKRKIFKSEQGKETRIFDYKLDFLQDTDKSHYAFYVLMDLVDHIVLKDQYHIKEFIKKDSVVIDAGANIGIFSLYAHRLEPTASIYAFEPTPIVFKILEQNIKNNGLEKNISSYNLALGDVIGEKEMLMDLSNPEGLGVGNSLTDSGCLTGTGKFNRQKIKITTIDDFVLNQHLSKVDFIKIDTEGYEKQIIKGAADTIKRFHPRIACSGYHLKGDLIEIPKLVLSIDKDYQYKLSKSAEVDFIFWCDKKYENSSIK